jgi:hypothetical protein
MRPTCSFGTFRYTSGALSVGDGAPVVELPPPLVPFPLGTDEVGGGVEIDALAPVCAATCSAQVKDRKNEIRSRQAIEAAIMSATT